MKAWPASLPVCPQLPDELADLDMRFGTTLEDKSQEQWPFLAFMKIFVVSFDVTVHRISKTQMP